MNWDMWVKDVFGSGMSWAEFTPGLIATIIGTLIGIFLPFYIQRKIDCKNEIKSAVQHLRNIKEELDKIKTKLSNPIGGLELNPIDMPVWDGLVSANELNFLISFQNKVKTKTLRGKNKGVTFEDKEDWYKLLFYIYAELGDYNLWCNLLTEKSVAKEDNETLKEITGALEKKRKLLCGQETTEGENSIDHITSLIEDAISTYNKRR